jgi:putative isomerase
MMGFRDVSPDRAWNTWDPARPASLTYLPGGLSLRIQAYSTKLRQFTEFPFTPEVRLGAHDTLGRHVELELNLGGTQLGLTFEKLDPFTITGNMVTRRLGEWGLRFWVLLEMGFEGDNPGVVVRGPGATALSRGRPTPMLTGATARILSDELPYDSGGAGPHLTAIWRSLAFTLETDPTPLYAHLHDDARAVGQTLQKGGYFQPQSFAREGKFGTLLFNLEESPAIRFALAADSREERAQMRAREALVGGSPAARNPLPKTPTGTDLLDAIESVLAWNTVQDSVNRRWFTALTRNWVQDKFGGWLVWLNDLLYHALLAAWVGDMELARRNLDAVLTSQTPAGNFPCLVSEYTEWVDRSQPPIAAHVIWQIYLLSGDASLVSAAYPALVRNHRWWLQHRDGNGNGLLEYGTGLTGSGSFLGTALAARDESSMDNSPIHDGVSLDPVVQTLQLEDVALNSLLVEDADRLADMADLLGVAEDGQWFRQAADTRRQLISRELWDHDRSIFANRRWNGLFQEGLAPTSFFPLAVDAADAAQVPALLHHLADPNVFGGEHGVPGTDRRHPAARDNVYWRGRIWPPLNYWVYQGLRRTGHEEEASRLAVQSVNLFWQGWRDLGGCFENFNADNGRGDDSPDTDRFYTWGALMPLLGIQELIDVTPRDGLTLGSSRSGAVDGVVVRGVRYGVRVKIDGMQIFQNGTQVLETDQAIRLRQVLLTRSRVELVLPPLAKPLTLVFGGLSDGDVHASIDRGAGADPLKVMGPRGSLTVNVPVSSAVSRLVVQVGNGSV